MNDTRLFHTLRLCRGQYSKPPGVSAADIEAAESKGFLRFEEWPSGHFRVTDAGREFMAEVYVRNTCS